MAMHAGGGWEVDGDREAGGPGGCGQQELDFIKGRWEDPGYRARTTTRPLLSIEGGSGHCCPREARLGKDDKGFAVGREDTESLSDGLYIGGTVERGAGGDTHFVLGQIHGDPGPHGEPRCYRVRKVCWCEGVR